MNLAALAVCAAALSCGKASVPGSVVPGEKGEPDATVLFRIDDPEGTRATGVSPSDERRVNRWALYLFDKDSGTLSGAVEVEGSDAPIGKTVTPGTYIACAVVNYATEGTGAFAPASVSTRSALEGTVAYLSHNSVSSLVMYGSEEFTLSEGDNGTKGITVSRLVTRLVVKKVTVNMERPSDGGKTFVLKGIYVTNAYCRCRLGADYAPSEISSTRSLWYNTMGYHTSGSCTSPGCPDDLLGTRTSINLTIANGSSYDTVHSFYAYPNATQSDQHGLSWNSSYGKRRTRIIIEATLGGTTYYYQVNLPPTARNNSYTIENAVITRPGSTSPAAESPPGSIDVRFSSSTDSWEGPETVTESS